MEGFKLRWYHKLYIRIMRRRSPADFLVGTRGLPLELRVAMSVAHLVLYGGRKDGRS